MFVAAQFTTLAIFEGADGKPDILLGAQVYTSLLGAVMVLVAILVFAFTRERYYERLVATRRDRVPLKDTLYRTLANREFRRMLGMMMAYMMATAMVGTLGYYATVYFVCGGNLVDATRWNSMMGLSGMVFGLAGIAFAGPVARRRGKRDALIIILVLAIAAFVGDWFFYDPARPALQLLASGCVAFTAAGFGTIYGSAMADVSDEDGLDSGQRREGSVAAGGAWISKVGLAVGILGSGWVLQVTGFDAKLPVQGDHAILLIRILLSGIPVAGLLVALAFVWRFGLTERRVREIRVTLEARRGAV